jgi:(E)-4-hydroxy-3-methylbut-2-enyl-diphosphate synthase
MERLYCLKKTAVIAIMGCAVNGPQEAKHADLGITGAGGKVLIFRRGRITRTVSPGEADRAFEEELESL